MINQGGRANFPKKLMKFWVVCVRVRKYPKIMAPMIIVKIIVVTFMAPATAFLNELRVILLKTRGMTKAPKAPQAAASVGVANPAYIDPITTEAKRIKAQSGRRELHRSLQV